MDMFDTLTPNLKSLIGTRIKLIKMNDPFPIPSGTIGVVEFIDDMNHIHLKWENGSTLSLIYGEDQFEILEEEDGN